MIVIVPRRSTFSCPIRTGVLVSIVSVAKAMANTLKRSDRSRVQYAALPWRRYKSATEVMLVTSRGTGQWIIPKGWPMKRKAPHIAAAREALEEAGVVGQVSKEPIGSFSHKKLLKQGHAMVEVKVFSLEVTSQRKTWPEKGERQVRWLSPSDAAKTVREPVLAKLISNLRNQT